MRVQVELTTIQDLVAPVGGSAYVQAPVLEYVIDLRSSADGRLIRRYRRNVDWLPASDPRTPSLKPQINALIHRAGFVWVGIAVPPDRLAGADVWTIQEAVRGGEALVPVWEVISLATGEVVARVVGPDLPFDRMTPDGRAVRFESTDEGTRFEVRELGLVRIAGK